MVPELVMHLFLLSESHKNQSPVESVRLTKTNRAPDENPQSMFMSYPSPCPEYVPTFDIPATVVNK